MDLAEYLNSAQKNLFRFEFLQDFNIPEERSDFELWKREHIINLESMKEWWNFIESKISDGIKMQRVRLVKFPLTEYTKYELENFKDTINHGDEIKIITEYEFTNLAINLKDFWLIDDRIALDMKYTEIGKYISFEVKEDISSYLDAKNLLLQNSKPLNTFLHLYRLAQPT